MSTTSIEQVENPGHKQRRVSVTMQPELYDRLMVLARHEKRSMGAEVSYLVEEKLRNLVALEKSEVLARTCSNQKHRPS